MGAVERAASAGPHRAAVYDGAAFYGAQRAAGHPPLRDPPDADSGALDLRALSLIQKAEAKAAKRRVH
jgi:hypothetical protein